jgi:hypothetical protein
MVWVIPQKWKENEQAKGATMIKDGVVVSLHIGYWQGKKALKAEDLGLDPSNVPDIFNLGQKMLIPLEERNAFRNIETRARQRLEALSFHFFASPGSRFVPLKGLGKVLEDLKNMKGEFDGAVEDILSRYQTIRVEMLEKYSELRDKLEPYYPSPTALRSKYYFKWEVYQISAPDASEAVPEDLVAEYAKFKDSLRREFEGFLEEAARDLRAQVAEKAEAILKKINSGEIIRSQTLDSVRSMIDRFETLNFIGDKTVEQALAKLRKSINGSTGEDVAAGSDLREKIGEAAKKVAEAAGNQSDISQVAGRYRRAIMM